MQKPESVHGPSPLQRCKVGKTWNNGKGTTLTPPRTQSQPRKKRATAKKRALLNLELSHHPHPDSHPPSPPQTITTPSSRFVELPTFFWTANWSFRGRCLRRPVTVPRHSLLTLLSRCSPALPSARRRPSPAAAPSTLRRRASHRRTTTPRARTPTCRSTPRASSLASATGPRWPSSSSRPSALPVRISAHGDGPMDGRGMTACKCSGHVLTFSLPLFSLADVQAEIDDLLRRLFSLELGGR